MDSITSDTIRQGASRYLESLRKMTPRHTNRVSDIGHKCLAYLYFSRVNWDKAESIPESLIGIFETGNEIEDLFISAFNRHIGRQCEPELRIVGQSTAVVNDKLLRDYQISGTLDGYLQAKVDGEWKTHCVIDVKSASGNLIDHYNDYEGLFLHSWSSRYPTQLMLYALANNMEKCCLMFVNKNNHYDYRTLFFDVDMEVCDKALQKADIINKAIEAQQVPEKFERPDICDRCRFKSWCNPTLTYTNETKTNTDPELENTLRRIDELDEAQSELNKLKKQLDSMLIKGQNVATASHLITWSQNKNGVWRKKIERV